MKEPNNGHKFTLYAHKTDNEYISAEYEVKGSNPSAMTKEELGVLTSDQSTVFWEWMRKLAKLNPRKLEDDKIKTTIEGKTTLQVTSADRYIYTVPRELVNGMSAQELKEGLDKVLDQDTVV